MTETLTAAADANKAVDVAREALREAVVLRSATIQAAFSAGHSAPEVAKALGVHRERVYVMAKQ